MGQRKPVTQTLVNFRQNVKGWKFSEVNIRVPGQYLVVKSLDIEPNDKIQPFQVFN